VAPWAGGCEADDTAPPGVAEFPAAPDVITPTTGADATPAEADWGMEAETGAWLGITAAPPPPESESAPPPPTARDGLEVAAGRTVPPGLRSKAGIEESARDPAILPKLATLDDPSRAFGGSVGLGCVVSWPTVGADGRGGEVFASLTPPITSDVKLIGRKPAGATIMLDDRIRSSGKSAGSGRYRRDGLFPSGLMGMQPLKVVRD
jgi:hypothetical protein